jgi:hypothetical protein
MRFLKVLTVGMGVLIVVATTVLVVVIAQRIGGTRTTLAPASVDVLLDEPAGTRIAAIASAGDRLAVQLQGGGADRVVLVDPRTGAVTGRIGLRTP